MYLWFILLPAAFTMAPTTTPRDVCRHCGIEWRPGWERCHRCGATLRNRVATATTRDSSGLELDRRPRTVPREEPTARVPAVQPSEAPTRELAPEEAPRLDPATRIALIQMLAGVLGTALLGQVLLPTVLPSMTALAVSAFRGERVDALSWILAAAPWALTGLLFALALDLGRAVVSRTLVRSAAAASLVAVLPGILLLGWPTLHGHLASALVRRGGRRRAALLTGWSTAVLGSLPVAVVLTFLDGLGLVNLPPWALAGITALALAAREGHLCALVVTLPGLLVRPGRRGAPLPSQLTCPECGPEAPTLQRFREGLAGSACARCAGALVGPGQASTLLSMAQVEDATYRREIRLGATGSRPFHCPQCGTAMRGVQLKSVSAHGCPACGSLWIDRVGLARLTGGRPLLTAAPERPAPPVGRVWPALAAVAALLLAAVPWVAARVGWCHPEVGACASVTVSATME